MDQYFSKQEQLEFLNSYFLSTEEALNILQISKQNFYSLVNRQKLTRIKKGGAVLYYRVEVIERANNQPSLRKKYRPYDNSN
ncbi:helix-turn-helix domain-containing protein [Listeria kieliensis]|uniref:Helix-turn-helix domain-containing protein n=1 Tax=Listeria kieliensis TaxID=1621700 RepID=A0A3D8TR84_9LIST|nr:helix-turn-helix domain-containing protein [Listeria kieliensis]RDX01368.1 hypothetical protein UR08_10670 [Listeria kieliensis]